MANYENLKATINANVRQNGNEEITGQVMNSVLNQMVDEMGADIIHSVRNFGEKVLSLNVIDDKVELTISPNGVTLDTIAYENLTYRQIFEDNNFLGISPGFEDGSISPLVRSAGSPALQSVEVDTGSYALNCSGTSSQQIKTSASSNHPAYTAARVKITSWTAGYAGIQYGTGTNGGINRVTDGWETIVADRYYTSNSAAFVGSFSSANLTGYVDTPVVVLKAIFSVVPDLVQFQALYDTYCELKRSESERILRTFRLMTYPESPYAADACKAAFVRKMNEKAQQIGATTAIFMDASGLVYAGSQATAMDMLRILVHAGGIQGIAEKWNCKTYNINIKGENSRVEVITSSVQNDNFTYPILGGKTGTLLVSGTYTGNVILCCIVEGKEIALCLMGAGSNDARWQDVQAVCDYIGAILRGESATLSISASKVAACLLPPNPIMYNNITLPLLASKYPDTIGTRPASMTKVMALITAYDYITDENEYVEIESSDLIGGSGQNLSAGDKITIRDLVYDMLLPSSNDAATALSRHIGGKILNIENT